MAIADRRQREKEFRRTEILDVAERLFFSKGYDDVSVDEIANQVELNKATIYFYFKNKEALFSAIVLRGYHYLNRMYRECVETNVPGINQVALLAGAYYRFNRQYPDYMRMIRYYSSERFSKSASPEADEVAVASAESRSLIGSAVQHGIDDGTIRNDIDPLEITIYLMITFGSILSLDEKWLRILDERRISHETFAQDFLRFITPAVDIQATKRKPRVFDIRDLGYSSLSLIKPIELVDIQKKRNRS